MLKLLKYLKPFIPLVCVGVLFLFGQAMADLYLPTIMSDIVNKGMLMGNTQYIYSTGARMLLVALVGSCCAVSANFTAARLATGFARDLRNLVFTKITGYSLQDFEKIGASSLITRTTNDITQIQTVFVMGFRFLLFAPAMCIGGFIMAMSKDRSLSLILAAAMALLVTTIAILAKTVMPFFRVIQKKTDRLNLILRENLTGLRVIRAFNKTDYEKKRFSEANRDLTGTSIRVNRMMAFMQPIVMILFNITSLSIIWFSAGRIAQSQLNVGDMMAVLQYATQIMMSLMMFSMMFIMVSRSQASAARINEVLDLESGITDPPEPKSFLSGFNSAEAPLVEFRNVSFTYPGAEQPILKDISFVSRRGETTAIVGSTGSGKSTLVNLIPRFYDVSQGELLVCGTSVTNVPQKALREKIGFVPQNAILFSGTVSDNIRFGMEDVTQVEIEQAARISQATEFISRLPQGLESEISQGGTNVSGGQKQRLSFARAIVRKPDIYIFDDSFSALDFKTESLLRAALKEEIGDATVLIVAQRISTVMDADRIVVLDNGEIAGIGRHRELMKNCEVYRQIVASQLSEEEAAEPKAAAPVAEEANSRFPEHEMSASDNAARIRGEGRRIPE